MREFKKSLTSSKIVSEIPRQTRHLMLWTERGAARHAKMLDTDQAWEVFEKLEDCYFAVNPVGYESAPYPASHDRSPTPPPQPIEAQWNQVLEP